METRRETIEFVTQYNFDYTAYGQEFKKPSLTIPSLGFTIKEILRRSMNNTLPSIEIPSYYEENPTHESEDIFVNDLTDISDGRLSLDEMFDSVREQQKESHPDEQSESEAGASETDAKL